MRIQIRKDATQEQAAIAIAVALQNSGYADPAFVAETAAQLLKVAGRHVPIGKISRAYTNKTTPHHAPK